MQEKLKVVSQDLGGGKRLTFTGIIDEDSDLGVWIKADAGTTLHFDLRGIRRINSCGVREWVNAVKALGDKVKLVYEACSIPIVEQLNMIANFAGNGRVVSFLAPYVCESCDCEHEELVDVATHFAGKTELSPPVVKCSECGEPMEFDEDEDEYFLFLESQLRKAGT